MKIYLLFLFALCGLSAAARQYEYQYEARLAAGMPSINGQTAGTGIKAKLLVSVNPGEKTAVVKMQDIQVGQYHGCTSCRLTTGERIQYQSVSSQDKAILEEPFTVHYNAREGQTVLEVFDQDFEWHTNVRKSIAQHLKVVDADQFLRPLSDPSTNTINIGGAGKGADSGMSVARSFFESTILGTCESRYTMAKVPAGVARRELAPIMAAAAAEGGEVYRLVRSLNLDNCTDEVLLQHAGLGNTTRHGHGQFRAISSRSSVGEYYLTKEQDGTFRISRADIAGEIIQRPFGFLKNEMHVFTNQTMQLTRAVKGSPQPIKATGGRKSIQTWKFGVISPNSAPEEQVYKKDWVRYLNKGGPETPLYPEQIFNGFHSLENLYSKLQSNVEQLLEKAARMLMSQPQGPQGDNSPWGSSTGEATRYMHEIARIINGLPKSEISQIFKQVFSQNTKEAEIKQMLLTDAIAAAGSGASVKVLLENMQHGLRSITPIRATTIFMTLTNNMQAPALISDLLEFAKTLDMKSQPMLTGNTFINFASLVHHQCVRQHFKNYTIPMPVLGNQVCQKQQVVEELLQVLRTKLQQTTAVYEKSMLTWAIGNIGSHKIMSVLEPIILGESEKNPVVRITAIHALDRWRQSHKMRSQVFKTLMPVIENLKEATEIRQAAVGALLTWHPDSAWWYRMAALTWRDPSRSMRSFVSSTIHSYSHFKNPHLERQTKFAYDAYRMARPVAPSYATSYNFARSRLYLPWKIRGTFDLEWIIGREQVPREIFTYLRAALGQFKLPVLEGRMINQNMNQYFRQLFNLPAQQNAQSQMSRFAEEIATGGAPAEGSLEPEVEMFMRVFDNIHYFVPLNKETIESFAQSGQLAQVLRGQRTDLKMTKYLNPISYNSFVPSDIGLPVISSNSVPSLIMTEGQIQVSIPGGKQPSWEAIKQAGEIAVSSDLNMRLVSKVISQMQVFVPWTNKTLCTGLDTEKTFQAPGKYNVLYKYYSIPSSGVTKFNFTVAATPSVNHEFPIAYAHNIPFTAIKNLWPVSAPESGDYQVINHNTHKQPLVKSQMQFGQKYLGMKFGLKWAADADLPLFAGYITEALRHPQRIIGLLASPVGRLWRATLTLDPSASQADTIRYSGSFATAVQTEGGAQGAAIPDVYGFNPQNTFPVPKIQSESVILFQNDLATYKRQGLQWANQRAYHSVLDFSFGKDSNERYTAFNFAVVRSAIPGVDSQQKTLCGMLTKLDPFIQNYEQLKSKVQSGIQGSLSGTLVLGPYCNQGQKRIGYLHGNMKVSQQRQAMLANELQRDQASMFDLNPTHSFPVSAAYDRASIQVKWDEQSWPKQLLNATYFLDDQVKGYLFPHVSVDSFKVQNPQGQMEVEGYRPLSFGHWQFYATKPRENVWVERSRVPEVFETFLPLWGFNVPKNAETKQFVQTP